MHRLWLTLLFLPACSLVTDFDRSYPKVTLELSGPVPLPEAGSGLARRQEACLAGCRLVQDCLYSGAVGDECARAPDGSSQASVNHDFYLHACVGTCLTADTAAALLDLATCDDIAAIPQLVTYGQAIFCQGETSVCSEAFLCLDLPRPLPTLFEACIDLDLGGECVSACESLPEPFWACVSQDTFFDLESFKQQIEDEGGVAEPDEIEARLVRVMCERLARCAGAPPPELFNDASAPGPPEEAVP
ncbi:MAG: hypothetical protein R3F60_07565 [bacterium]